VEVEVSLRRRIGVAGRIDRQKDLLCEIELQSGVNNFTQI